MSTSHACFSARRGGGLKFAPCMAFLCLAVASPAWGQTSCGIPPVLTGQNDNNRDSYNSSESCLTESNVNEYGLKELTVLQVDMDDLPTSTPPAGIPPYSSNPIYAQPLFIPGITNSSYPNCSSTCDMVVAATLNGTIFAWNADTLQLVWSRRGGPSGTTTGNAGTALWYGDCNGATNGSVGVPFSRTLPFVGVISTPVIDSSL